MAQVTVTVNGTSVKEYVFEELGKEVHASYSEELRGFKRSCGHVAKRSFVPPRLAPPSPPVKSPYVNWKES
jgi:hypothetical protein